MKVAFFDLLRLYQEQKEEIDRAISQVLGSGSYILGSCGEKFEIELKKNLVGNEDGFVLGCNSGTDALALSLMAAEVHPGDQVITVSHTAIPTISAICSIGAIPSFVEVNSRTWVIDVLKIEEAITQKTKAIIAVHLYGNMAPIFEIKEILTKLGREDIRIIEDVAQAQGATLKNRQAGTLGRLGAFSFYPTKNLGALGDGGGIFCSTEKDASLVAMLRNYGKKGRDLAFLPRGANSRLDEIQAAILSVRLSHLDRWNLKKERLLKDYRTSFSDLPMVFQEITEECKPAWHLCVLALESEKVRNQLRDYLLKKNIETLIHYPIPSHLHPVWISKSNRPLRITEDLAKRILSIPFNAALEAEEQAYVIEVIRSFFGKTR